jgi:hypothetical protein
MTKNQSLGDKFKAWCEMQGRKAPAEGLVEALNNSLDEGIRVAKSNVRFDLEGYRNFRSFLARSH